MNILERAREAINAAEGHVMEGIELRNAAGARIHVASMAPASPNYILLTDMEDPEHDVAIPMDLVLKLASALLRLYPVEKTS